MTDAERRLWEQLRARRTFRVPFRRQAPISGYVVDFCSFELRLIIEVDGSGHSPRRDGGRDRFLRSQGFEILRFDNVEVLTNLEGVLEAIRLTIECRSPSP